MATKIWVGTDTGNEGDWATAANWSPSGVPVDGDDVYFLDSTQDVTSGLGQSAVVLDSLHFERSWTGIVDGTLEIGADRVEIGAHWGQGSPAGSDKIDLDLGSTAAEIVIHHTSRSSEDDYIPPVRIVCNSASTNLYQYDGKAALAAADPTETATIGDVHVEGGTLEIGSGVTLTNLYQIDGTAIVGCGATLLELRGGELVTVGSGAVTTLRIYGGSAIPNSTGTVTTLELRGGEVDYLQSAEPRTVTNLKLYAAGTLRIDPDIVTVTTPTIEERATLRAG